MAFAYHSARVYSLDGGARDCVYVSASLAYVLSQGDDAEALAVSLASPDEARAAHASLSSVGSVYWAQIASPEMEGAAGMEHGAFHVFVPPLLCASLPERVAVRGVQPIPLHAAFLGVDAAHVEHVARHEAAVRDALHGSILHCGEAVNVTLDGMVLALQVAMTEPVVQGVVERTSTKLTVLGINAPPPSAAPVRPDPVVDAHFLERALAHAQHGTLLTAKPASIEVAQAIAQCNDAYIDAESVVLVSEAMLAGLAALNGDWCVAQVAAEERPHMVRLLATQCLLGMDEARCSPVLLQNMYRPETFRLQDAVPLTVYPIPSAILDELESLRVGDAAAQNLAGAPGKPPLLPAAEGVTVARIASPVATDRAYDEACLEALRRHFEHRPRILRLGDVFAVPVETGRARFEQVDVEREHIPQESARDLARHAHMPGALVPKHARDAVFFAVTELESALVDPSTLPIPEDAPALRQWFDTLATYPSMDYVGAYVDAAHSKIVQTGLEQRRVADVQAWLALAQDTPPCPPLHTPLTEGIFARYVQLVQAAISPSAQRLGVHLCILLHGAKGVGKRMLTRWVAQRTGVQLLVLNCYELVSDTDARTEGMLRARFERARICAPCLVLLQHIDVLVRKGQEAAQSGVFKALQAFVKDPQGLVIVGTTEDEDACVPALLGLFNETLSLSPPSETERKQLLEMQLAHYTIARDIDVQALAMQTAALLAADIAGLVERARLASIERLAQSLHLYAPACPWKISDLAAARPVLVQADLEAALAHVRTHYSESIGAPKIPNVTWDDVGGLAAVKNEILDTVQLPLEHPELFADGVKKRSGVLLYGPPGTGKTLLAKAVATTCSLNFFSVKGPELLNMYIGESEANVRRVFQRARDAKPCVIFFDELDSVAPKRGNQGDSGGVMDRIVSQLLAELDGMASGSEAGDVFVIGATNRPDLLDAALLRPGRFDRMLYLSVAETHDAQLTILQALTRKFTLDEDVGDLRVVAEQCPFNLTGADFYALCSDAMLKAMTAKAGEVDVQVVKLSKEPRTDATRHWPTPMTPQYYLAEIATPGEIQFKVHRRHFEQALQELVPSVSEQEMAHYRAVQTTFSPPADDAPKKGKGRAP
ncbi:peroxisomal assembly protein [Malassezia vespertilionis]|uniref:Peroxisomal ATPase PEX6 n=1 Tax=Malassezia vespertilionis TaxID=2020962 RepID=A0A2N1JEX1_9BASI|nr:peroxisomal assembly protein [Malassezia vespertilionis]PKI85101.1 Pex6p [Malassezia vespertilionis]WFD06099.1 peroxisomal assembly protein [Malassezia vespertilionis]